MKNTSRRLTESANRINQTFAGRHYKTILDDPSYYLCAYKYIYRNPVEANIVSKVENYPYSSLNGLLGQNPLILPIVSDDTLFNSVEQTLQWLNTAPPTEADEATRWALKRPFFRLKKNRNSNKSIRIDDTPW